MKSGGNYCRALNCDNRFFNNKSVSYFRFPKDNERCRKWVVNCRVENLQKRSTEYLNQQCRLCSLHFEDNQFMNATKRQLLWNAIPTLFDIRNEAKNLPRCHILKRCNDCSLTELPAKPKRPFLCCSTNNNANISNDCITVATQTELATFPKDKFAYNKLYAKYRKLLQENTVLRKRLRKKTKEVKQKGKSSYTPLLLSASNGLSEMQKSFITGQIEASQRRARGMRWSNQQKTLAVGLLYKSPQAYNLIRNVLCLPSISVIKRFISHVKLIEGVVNDSLLLFLRRRVESMTTLARHCLLVFDAMTIKSGLSYDRHHDCISGLTSDGYSYKGDCVATHAFVIMARGLSCKWKIVTGYIFIRNTLCPYEIHGIVHQSVCALENIGLKVHGCIMDLEINQQTFQKVYGQGEDKNYIRHPCDQERKFWIIFDPPHILKCIRNNFLNYDIEFSGNKIARWSHILQLWKTESVRQIRMCPKLTEKHFYFNGFDKMKVKLAAQVLSNSVSAAIKTYVSFNVFPASYLDTAQFLSIVNNMYDCLNTSFQGNGAQHMFSKFEQLRCEKFLQYKNLVTTIVFKKPNSTTDNLPFKRCLLITLQSVYELTKHLFHTEGFSYFATRRCNQDCVENLFSTIRMKGLQRDNPTTTQFSAALKNIMVCAIFTNFQSSATNCEMDGDILIADSTLLHTNSVSKPLTQNCSTANLIPLLPNFNPIDNNTVSYIAGYVARRLSYYHRCTKCALISTTSTISDDRNTFISYKQREDVYTGLLTPADGLYYLCSVLEAVFTKFCGALTVRKSNPFHKFMSIVNRYAPCHMFFGECLEHREVLFRKATQLYFNTRIHFFIKQRNVANYKRIPNVRKNRKLVKLRNI